MQFIDLCLIKPKKLEATIKQICNGRLNFLDTLKLGGKGLAGLFYSDGIFKIDKLHEAHLIKEEPYKVNFELFKNGLGIYLQRRRDYFLYLLPFEELKSINIARFDSTTEGKQLDFGVQIYTNNSVEINLKSRLSNLNKNITFFEKGPLKFFTQVTV